MKTGNVGSLDVFRAAHLFTCGAVGQGIALRRSGMVSENQQTLGETNGMPSLFIRPTQVVKTGNVGSLDVFRAAHLFTCGAVGQGIALRRS